MDIATIAQVASTITTMIFVAVIGLGYYFSVKVSRETLKEMREECLSGGRPQVIVDDSYSRLPEVDIVVRNVKGGAAKDITFEFSAPVESSDGTVISDLAYFRSGMDFLSPDGEISCYWDHLDRLLPFLQERGLEEGIKVTTRYKDLAGESYATDWNLNPFVYKNRRYVQHKTVDDLAESLEKRLDDLTRAVEDRLGDLEDAVEKVSDDGSAETRDLGARREAPIDRSDA